MRIAVLDDEACQIELIRHTMEAIGHECHGFGSCRSMLRDLRQQSYDLLILGWNPPDLEWLGVLKWIRKELSSRLPILCVNRRNQEQDLVEALTAGADDLMVKPIRAAELQARVHALLRRAYPALYETELTYGPFRFLIPMRMLQVNGEAVELSYREYELALFLFQNLGRLLSREHLLEAVWGTGAEGPSRSLDTHMSRLRTKLDLRPANGLLLSAVYRLGYRLEVVDTEALAPPYPMASATE